MALITMFAIHNLVLSIYLPVFATYLQGATLCKSIFCPVVNVRHIRLQSSNKQLNTEQLFRWLVVGLFRGSLNIHL